MADLTVAVGFQPEDRGLGRALDQFASQAGSLSDKKVDVQFTANGVEAVSGQIDGVGSGAAAAEKSVQSLGTAIGSLGAGAGGGLAGVASGLGGIVSQANLAQHALNALDVAAGTMIAHASEAVLGFGKSIVEAGVGFDSLKEQSMNAFTTMLGSAEKAQAFIADMQQFAATTPFEFPGLIQSSQKLLAMGIAAKDVKPALTAIGDAVAGLGGSQATLDRVTLAIGQMTAKGKASAQEMMQLTEAGIPAWDMLAKKIGTDVPTAMKLVEQGAVSSSVAVNSVLQGMEDRFGGMMDVQSHTFQGLWSTIHDTFTQISGQVMEPFFNLVRDGMEVVVDAIGNGQIQSAADNLRDAFQGIAGGVKNFIEMVGNLRNVEGLDTVEAVLTAIDVKIKETFGEGASSLFENFTSMIAGVASAVATFSDDVRTSFEVTGDPIYALLTGIDQALIRTFGPNTAQLFENVTDAIGNMVSSAMELFGQFGGSAEENMGGVPSLVETIAGAVVALGETVGPPIRGFIDGTAELIGKFQSMSATTQELHGHMTLIGTVLGAAATAAGVLGAQFLATRAVMLATAVATNAAAIATNAQTVAQYALNLAMSLNPIGAVITVVGALAAGIVVLYNTNEGFRAKVIEVWNQVRLSIGGALQAIGPGLAAFGEALAHIPGPLGLLGSAMQFAGERAQDLAKTMTASTQAIADSVETVDFGEALADSVSAGQSDAEAAVASLTEAMGATGEAAAKDKISFPISSAAVAGIQEHLAGPGKKQGETAIQGFMEALASNVANNQSIFTKEGAAVASALAKGIEQNSGAAGAAVATAMDKLVHDLEVAGVPNWRALGDTLAGFLHNALIARTPATTEAALAMLQSVTATLDQARFDTALGKIADGIAAAFSAPGKKDVVAKGIADLFAAIPAAVAEHAPAALVAVGKAAADIAGALQKGLPPDEGARWATEFQEQLAAVLRGEAGPEALGDFLGRMHERIDSFSHEQLGAKLADDLARQLSAPSARSKLARAGEDAINAFTDAINNESDKTEEAASKAFGKLADAAKAELSPTRAAEVINGFSAYVQAAFNAGRTDLLEVARAYWATVTEGADAEKAQNAADTLADSIARRLESKAATFQSLGTLLGDQFTTYLANRTKENGSLIEKSVGEVVSGLEKSQVPGWQAMAKAVTDAWAQALRDGTEASKAAALQVTQAAIDTVNAADLATTITKVTQQINQAFGKLDVVSGFRQSMGEAFSAMDDIAATGSTKALESLGKLGSDAIKTLTDHLNPEQGKAVMGTFHQALLDVINTRTPEAIARLKTLWDGMNPTLANSMKANAQTAMQAMQSEFADAKWRALVGSNAGGLMDSIDKNIRDRTPQTQEAMAKAAASLLVGWEKGMPKQAFQAAVQELWRLVDQYNATGAETDRQNLLRYVSRFDSAGKAIPKAVADAMIANLELVRAASGQMGDATLAPFDDSIGRHSEPAEPAKRGDEIPQAVADHIKTGTQKVRDASYGMGQASVFGTTEGIADALPELERTWGGVAQIVAANQERLDRYNQQRAENEQRTAAAIEATHQQQLAQERSWDAALAAQRAQSNADNARANAERIQQERDLASAIAAARAQALAAGVYVSPTSQAGTTTVAGSTIPAGGVNSSLGGTGAGTVSVPGSSGYTNPLNPSGPLIPWPYGVNPYTAVTPSSGSTAPTVPAGFGTSGLPTTSPTTSTPNQNTVYVGFDPTDGKWYVSTAPSVRYDTQAEAQVAGMAAQAAVSGGTTAGTVSPVGSSLAATFSTGTATMAPGRQFPNITADFAHLADITTSFETFIAQMWPAMADPMRELPAILAPLLNQFPVEVQQALNGPLNAFITNFGAQTANASATIQQNQAGIISQIVAGAQTLADPIRDLPAMLAQWSALLPANVQSSLMAFAEKWATTNAPFLAAVHEWGQSSLGFTNSLLGLEQALATSPQAYQTALAGLPSQMQGVVSGLTSFLQGVIPTLANPAQQLPGILQGILSAFPPDLASVLTPFLTQLAGVLSGGAQAFATAIQANEPGQLGQFAQIVAQAIIPNNAAGWTAALAGLPSDLREMTDPITSWLRSLDPQGQLNQSRNLQNAIATFSQTGDVNSAAVQAQLALLPANIAQALGQILPQLFASLTPTPPVPPVNLPGGLAAFGSLFTAAGAGQSGTLAFLQSLNQYSGPTRGFVNTVVSAIAGNTSLATIVQSALAAFAQHPTTGAPDVQALLQQLPASVAHALREILITQIPTAATFTPGAGTGSTVGVSGIPSNIAQLTQFFTANSGSQGSSILAELQRLPQWKDEVLAAITQFAQSGTLSDARLQVVLQSLPANLRSWLTEFLPNLTRLPTGTTQVPTGGAGTGSGTSTTYEFVSGGLTLADLGGGKSLADVVNAVGQFSPPPLLPAAAAENTQQAQILDQLKIVNFWLLQSIIPSLLSIDMKLGPSATNPYLAALVSAATIATSGSALEQAVDSGMKRIEDQLKIVNFWLLQSIIPSALEANSRLSFIQSYTAQTVAALGSLGGGAGTPADIGPIYGAANGIAVYRPTRILSGEGQVPEITAPGPLLRRIGREEGWSGGGGSGVTIQVNGNVRMDQQWFEEMRRMGVEFRNRNGKPPF